MRDSALPHSTPSINSRASSVLRLMSTTLSPTDQRDILTDAMEMSDSTTPSRSPLAARPAASLVLNDPPPPRAVAPPIPKAITDRLMRQERQIEELILQHNDMAKTLTHVQDKIRQLIDNENDAANEQEQSRQHICELEQRLDNQSQRMDELLARLENRNAEGSTTAATSRSRARDNAFNTASRQVFFVAMGMPANSKYKDVAQFIRGTVPENGDWIVDPQSPSRVLRPDFNASFAENHTWHDGMVKFLKNKIPVYSPVLRKVDMDNIINSDVLTQIETVFKNMGNVVRKGLKELEDKGDEGEAEIVEEGGGKDADQQNRRDGRKVRKLEERQAAIVEAKFIIPPQCRFILSSPKYQSTDESDSAPSDVLDPASASDDEAPVNNKKTSAKKNRTTGDTPWQSRPPTYRTAEYQNIIDAIDAIVMARRDAWKRNNRGKTAAHKRVRGAPKNVPLPYIRGKGKLRIPRQFVDPGWLAANEESNTPSRIAQWDKEDSGSDGDTEDNDEE
ncbi:hypothetical protein C8F01DRAFT_1237204 [Mycena amicta]|nr:hypothetical protein C8F01DRAFT_1237204 [Mycena amicta]